jgi:dTDP-4-dehydrorhamnose reductase
LLQCHAICDVPRCEAAPEWAWLVNVAYLERLVDALPSQTRLVYVSSDHVFGGDGIYNESLPPCPISVYGRSRVAAERLVLQRNGSLVIRVGLPIGSSPDGRTGHWDWLRYRFSRKLPVTIVHDEYRSVVWATDLAARVMELTQSETTGIRHVPATRAISRIQLADYLLAFFSEHGQYARESRFDRPAPHLGRVELASKFSDALSAPLRSVLDGPPLARMRSSGTQCRTVE